MPTGTFSLRRAQRLDIPALRAMHAESLKDLGAAYYTEAAIAAFVARIGTLDAAVVEEGHYSLAEAADGTILGSGGWSRLVPAYACATGERSEVEGAATIRSVFVAPSAARKGIGSAIMAWAEADAAAHGFRRLRLKATLSGAPLYARLGFRALGSGAIDLGEGLSFGYVEMEKRIAAARDRAA
jgi:GNAT superfamily N-acetyltransferase